MLSCISEVAYIDFFINLVRERCWMKGVACVWLTMWYDKCVLLLSSFSFYLFTGADRLIWYHAGKWDELSSQTQSSHCAPRFKISKSSSRQKIYSEGESKNFSKHKGSIFFVMIDVFSDLAVRVVKSEGSIILDRTFFFPFERRLQTQLPQTFSQGSREAYKSCSFRIFIT